MAAGFRGDLKPDVDRVMPLADEVVGDARNGLLQLEAPPGSEPNTMAFARAKVAEARARLDLLLGQLAPPGAMRPDAEYRGELESGILPSWKDCLVRSPPAKLQLPAAEKRTMALSGCTGAVLPHTTLKKR